MEVLLSLGSNIEPRMDYIRRAISELDEFIHNMVVSDLYQTDPVGYTDQPSFVNVAVHGYTDLSAQALHAQCKAIEVKLGRAHRDVWREREIDIDVIIAGDTVVFHPRLTIPHARMSERAFVLIPSAEIAPGLLNPKLNKTIAQLLEECTDTSRVEPLTFPDEE